MDILSALGMHEDISPLHFPHAVTLDRNSDLRRQAYAIGEDASLNISVATIFPSGFPYNFSLLMRVKVAFASKGFMLAVHDEEDGPAWIAVKVDGGGTDFQRIVVQFRNMEHVTASIKVPVFRGTKWDSLGLTVVGNTVSFYWDCQLKTNESVVRDRNVPKIVSKLYLASSGYKRKKPLQVILL